ncbi:nitrate reductase molybdenum cofactor assembly chaperone [Rhodococcus rhodnii]|uniref:Uncharacterized protein n=2 Tax=Rhodococcus rhodnii TaxID=38312 RepID=R7WS70_9NOCA|nr:nitrate reductase molybdenum cofactor assembly chaperone [Rhodococcus rhodnii]EOM76789.1 hypothetical protein Rrhod_1909 [Rhodococcus rhodnii LMG 5362]TXG90034.1 nitrate reductase molybdenum cofactor assembly chaperone [Rhodococcus rhodnii]
MRLRRPRHDDRAEWAVCSLLLDYPGGDLDARLARVDALWPHLSVAAARALAPLRAHLGSGDGAQREREYVETFDLRRRATLYLTYWTAGDTRSRGGEMLAIATRYRESGSVPPASESPDHLAVVLDFASTVDPAAGRALLEEYRVALEMLRSSLAESGSPYRGALDAVCGTLGPVTDQQTTRARRLAAEGPPVEAVGTGVGPFNPTIPPRRAPAAVHERGA